MRIVVTGSTGHVGVNLVRALLARGREVVAFANRPSPTLQRMGVSVVLGDITSAQDVDAIFEGADVVYNLAAKVCLDNAEADSINHVNVGGPRNVVRGCLKAGVRRLVHFSSIHALSPYPIEAVVDETRAPNLHPETFAYDRSKALGEQEILEGVKRGLDAVIVSPSGVLGPFDDGSSHQGAALRDLHDGRIPALIDGGFNWVDVRDLVEGAIAAERHGRTGERYLLTGHWRSVPEMAAVVAQLSGRRAPRLVLPLPVAFATLPLMIAAARLVGREPPYTLQKIRPLREHRHISHEKAAQELGFHPRPFEQTVADALAWYSAAGMLRKEPLRPLAAVSLS